MHAYSNSLLLERTKCRCRIQVLRCFKKLLKCNIKNKDNIDWKVCVTSDIFLQNWWGMIISLNYPNVFNLVSFSLQSLFATSVKLSFSRASFYVLRIITWLSWICVIVVQNYVLMFLRIELEGSLTAFPAGASSINLSKNATSENIPFCGCVNLRSRLMINGTSMLLLRSSKRALSNDSFVPNCFRSNHFHKNHKLTVYAHRASNLLLQTVRHFQH